jgi:hypothetical protein
MRRSALSPTSLTLSLLSAIPVLAGALLLVSIPFAVNEVQADTHDAARRSGRSSRIAGPGPVRLEL